jgi:PAS domain S-box-containing protein
VKVYEGESGMYHFRHLPHFVQHIIDHHLDDYVAETIRTSYRMDIPVLRYLQHLSVEELFQQSKAGSAELLQYLANNQAKEFLQISMQRWLSNQLPLIGKFQIQAEDITAINHVRSEGLKRLIPTYSTDVSMVLEIVQEIDRFFLGSNTTATDTYIAILKDQLAEETHFNANVTLASPAITYIFDLESRKSIYVSGKVKEVLGYTPDEIIALGDNLLRQTGHPDDLALMAAGLRQMKEENVERTYMAEFRMKAKDGEYRWLRSYLVVFNRNENGEPMEVLGQVYEVSKEKELLSAIENRERQLLEAQSIARLGSFDWLMDTDETDYTPELRNIFETEQPQGYQQMLSRVHPNDVERVKAAMTQASETGMYESEFRYSINGKEKVLWAKGRIVFADGKPYRMLGTVQDVTERKRIEESLIEKTIALQKSNASLQEFASVASHDLKEPLRKIITFSDLLQAKEKEQLSVQGKDYLQKITDSAMRMKALIEDILAYSTLSGKEEKETVSLYRLVQDVLSTLEIPIRENGAKVSVSQLPEATVYPGQMTQLFQNLLSNALKFSKESESLRITISHDKRQPSQINGYAVQKATSYLQIQITDNGIGFTNEAAEKIFGLFSRLHSKSTYEGTGLGLAICRKVAENHGGVIYAESLPGEGSVFTVLLPAEG